jgi:predicted RNase H-like nuclease
LRTLRNGLFLEFATGAEDTVADANDWNDDDTSSLLRSHSLHRVVTRRYNLPKMTSILALDPAWTTTEPSGVALLQLVKDRWKCVALAPSYSQFIELAKDTPVDWSTAPKAARPDVDALLDAARTLLDGEGVDLVTIDMPVALTAIHKRREADSAVSQKFGSKGCSTHSPSDVRPGEVGKQLTDRFKELGYSVATVETPVGSTYVLAEVYPHPALLHLLGKDFRFKYKIGRASEYWPEKSPADRRRRIVKNWNKILDQLSLTINKIDLPLPSKNDLEHLASTSLKRYEDAIDALVCGWVGIKYLEGDCTAYGDESAAIWIPPGTAH